MIQTNNYTNMHIPRELIYEDKQSLDSFEINNDRSLNQVIYDEWLICLPELRPEETGVYYRELSIFNDAYYICTLVGMLNFADFGLKYYLDEISNHSIVLPMIYLYISKLKTQRRATQRLLKKIENSVTRLEGCKENLESLKKVAGSCQQILEPAVFSRRELTPTVLSKINWGEVTNGFSKNIVERVLLNIAINDDESQLIVDAIKKAVDKAEDDYYNPKPENYYDGNDMDYYFANESEDRVEMIDIYEDKRHELNELRERHLHRLNSLHKEQLITTDEKVEEDEERKEQYIEEPNHELAALNETNNKPFSNTQTNILVYYLAKMLQEDPKQAPNKQEVARAVAKIKGCGEISNLQRIKKNFSKNDKSFVAQTIRKIIPKLADYIEESKD